VFGDRGLIEMGRRNDRSAHQARWLLARTADHLGKRSTELLP
jgi:hypothetical protein